MRLPEIAEKLRPVIKMLDTFNEHFTIESFNCYEDGIECEVSIKGDEPTDNSDLNEYAESVYYAATEMLPDPHYIDRKNGRFMIARRTPEEQAAYEAAVLAEEGGEPPKPHHLFYRIAAEAGVNLQSGFAFPFVGDWHIYPWGDIKPKDLEDLRKESLKYIAKLCACSVEHVTPLTEEEYLAAGGVLDDSAETKVNTKPDVRAIARRIMERAGELSQKRSNEHHAGVWFMVDRNDLWDAIEQELAK